MMKLSFLWAEVNVTEKKKFVMQPTATGEIGIETARWYF